MTFQKKLIQRAILATTVFFLFHGIIYAQSENGPIISLDKTQIVDDSLGIVYEVKISLLKSALDTPSGIMFTMSDSLGIAVKSLGVPQAYLSGTRHDGNGVFDHSATHFLFNIGQLPPGNYEILFNVFLADGDPQELKLSVQL